MRTLARFFSLLFLSACCCVAADDRALLDLLVEKGALDSLEAQSVAKSLVEVSAISRSEHLEKLRFYGAIQTQYHFATSSEKGGRNASRTSNGFQIRRLFVGAYADLGGGMMGVIDLDMCGCSIKNAPFLNAAFFSKKFETEYLDGTAYLGYLKVNFAIEEYTPATRLITLDRSMVTRYFTIEQRAGSGNVGFGSAYTGAFWHGRGTRVKGLGYGFAVTNSQNYSIRPHTSDDYGKSVNVWADAYYDSRFELMGQEFEWRVGSNFGYGNKANSKLNSEGFGCGEVWGVNPYVKIKWEGLTLWSEFVMTGIEHGRARGTQDAMPMGVNTWIEYTFDLGEWGRAGPVFRYSYLNTDGRGARISDCLAGVGNVDSSGDDALNLYDTAQSFSIGANWYLLGNNLKIQAAYEWAQFDGAVSHSSVASKRADANVFRIQMQVIF